VVAAGVLFHGGWMMFGALTLYQDRRHLTHSDKRIDGG
jgi:hypothetical protein